MKYLIARLSQLLASVLLFPFYWIKFYKTYKVAKHAALVGNTPDVLTAIQTFEFNGHVAKVISDADMVALMDVSGPTAAAAHGCIYVSQSLATEAYQSVLPALLHHEAHHLTNDFTDGKMTPFQAARYQASSMFALFGFGYCLRLELAADQAAVRNGCGAQLAEFLSWVLTACDNEQMKLPVRYRLKALTKQGFKPTGELTSQM
jgi:hypothetical protein